MSLLAGLRAPIRRDLPVLRHDAGELVHPGSRRDSTYNPISGLGGPSDKGQVARPNPYVIPLSDQELDSLYSNAGLPARIVNILPSRATRRGWTVPDIGDEDRRLGTWDFFRDGMTWARLYGGCAGVMVTEDDVPAGFDKDTWLREPLDLKRVGKVLALRIFDAMEAWPCRWGTDIRSPRYGLPEYWQVSSASGFRGMIHASRVVHFRGTKRPPSRARTNWQSRFPDDSCLQSVWDEIRRLTEVQQAGAVIAQELRQGVLSISGLAAKATSDEGETLWSRLRDMKLLQGLLGTTVIDKEDLYQNLSNPPTGYAELSEGGWTALSAATGIPQTILQGESPGGLSSDGESAQEGFRQLVSDYQSVNLSCFEQLYSVVYAQQDGPTRGKQPEDWTVTFAALDEPSEATMATTQLAVVQADEIRIRTGVVSPETVTRSRYGEAGWNFELEAEEDPEGSEEEILAAARGALGTEDPTGAVANVAATALNGAQVTALVDIVVQVAAGSLPRDAAVAIVQRAFQVEATEADELLGSAGNGFVPTAEPAAPGFPKVDSDQSVCILIPAADPGLRAAAESAIGQTLVAEDEPHITLLYLGDVDPAALAEISAIVAEEAKASRVSTIQNAAIRPFPVGSDGTPVVLEFEDGYELAGLHDRLLVRLAHLISAQQFPRFRPHLTLGYATEPLSTQAVTALVELEVDVKVPLVEIHVMAGRKRVSSAMVGG